MKFQWLGKFYTFLYHKKQKSYTLVYKHSFLQFIKIKQPGKKSIFDSFFPEKTYLALTLLNIVQHLSNNFQRISFAFQLSDSI